MKKCLSCGFENRDEDNFCIKCGITLQYQPYHLPPQPKSPYELKLEKVNWMREHPEPAEKRMLEILSSSVVPKFPEQTFYFQSLQYGYILDFYCPTLRLAIEVDGSSHNNKRGYDWERQDHLERKGIQIFRASNVDVFSNPQGLANSLCKIMQERTEQGHKRINEEEYNGKLRYEREKREERLRRKY